MMIAGTIWSVEGLNGEQSRFRIIIGVLFFFTGICVSILLVEEGASYASWMKFCFVLSEKCDYFP